MAPSWGPHESHKTPFIKERQYKRQGFVPSACHGNFKKEKRGKRWGKEWRRSSRRRRRKWSHPSSVTGTPFLFLFSGWTVLFGWMRGECLGLGFFPFFLSQKPLFIWIVKFHPISDKIGHVGPNCQDSSESDRIFQGGYSVQYNNQTKIIREIHPKQNEFRNFGHTTHGPLP